MTEKTSDTNMSNFSDKARQRWVKLTNDDISSAAGQRDAIVAKIEERYGKRRSEAEKEFDEWHLRQRVAL
ncbi:MAG: CsbD family protein [Pseudomonadota bacterium]